jgi:hypothetical protein
MFVEDEGRKERKTGLVRHACLVKDAGVAKMHHIWTKQVGE